VSLGISHTKFTVPSVLRSATSCHGDTFWSALERSATVQTLRCSCLSAQAAAEQASLAKR